MNALSPIVKHSELVASIERARALLDDGDVEAALLLASGVYEQAKAAGGYAKKVKASRELVDKARRMQAEALKIESICYVAMADAVDAAQAKGELASRGQRPDVQGSDKFTLEEVGVDRRRLHEARSIRNAERAEPGFIERVVEARLDEGLEPSRAGLKKAAGHAIGTKTATKGERGDDLYETPAEAMTVLLALESFSATVLEPSVGKGAILRPLEAAGYEVMISDLVDRGIVTQHGELQQVGDFLTMSPGEGEGADIVTNPPYGIANAYIAHALKVFRPRKMALLLNLNFLAGFDDPDRIFVMDENPPSRVYVFTRRLPMMHRDGWEGKKASSQMNTGWFIWERNEDGSYGDSETRLIRVDWARFADAPALFPGPGGNVSPALVMGPCVDVEFARDTPRRTLEERIDAALNNAIDWISTTPDAFDEGALRRRLGIRPSTAAAVIERLQREGRIVTADGGYMWAGESSGVDPRVEPEDDGGEVGGDGPQLPPKPGRTAPISIDIGGMRTRGHARICISLNGDGSHAISMEYELKGFAGGSSPPSGSITRYVDALRLALHEMRRKLSGIIDDKSSLCTDRHRAAARDGVKWIDGKLKEWRLDGESAP